MKKVKYRLLRNAVGLPILLCLLFVLIQMPATKSLLARSLSNGLSQSEDLQVQIGTISGLIPVHVEISSIKIGDAEGIWLRADKLQCNWLLKELLNKHIRVSQLSANRIEIDRLPLRNPAEKPAREKKGFTPVKVTIDKLKVNRFILGQQLAGQMLDYSIFSGGLKLRPDGVISGAIEIGGDADGSVELNAKIGEQLQLISELRALRKPNLGLDHLAGFADLTLSTNGVNGIVSTELRKGTFEAQVAGLLSYRNNQLSASNVNMMTGGNQLVGNTLISFTPSRFGVLADVIVTDVATNDYSIGTAATISKTNDQWQIEFDNLSLSTAGYLALSSSGTVAYDKIDLRGHLSSFDIQQLPFAGTSNLIGQVNGSVLIGGSFSAPIVTSELSITNFTSTQSALNELPELDFAVNAELQEGVLRATTSLSNPEKGNLKFDARMPCALTLSPYNFLPEPQRLTAELIADMDLAILNRLADFNDQRITGQLAAQFALDRALDPHQQISGFLKIDDGAYEHYDWGVMLRDIAMELTATTEGLMIRSASATDGREGTVTASGGVDIWESPIPLDIAIQMNHAAMIQRDDVEAMLSGDFKLNGMLARPELSGTLIVDRADVQLDNIAPPPPPLLTDFDATQTNETMIAKKANASPIGLDLKIELSDQVFLNASVIDSVWGGSLTVKDTTDGISLAGRLRPDRGYFSFVGKKFRLTKDGWVDFDGSIPASPSLNIITEYSRSDILAQLTLVGRLNNPQFKLTSTPSYPEDEVLSHVLFGRDTSSISAYQAYQIAAAARQLSGGLKGPGVMYQVRQSMGIDTLEWREADTVGGSSSVAAGKYLTPALYIEVNSSLDENAGAGMMAEYELTRHFSVETSMGPTMRPGIGFNWKNDY